VFHAHDLMRNDTRLMVWCAWKDGNFFWSGQAILIP